MIEFELIVGNGTTAKCHKVVRVEATDEECVAVINSFAVADGQIPAWQDRYVIPVDVLASGYPDAVEAWAVGADGPMAGGLLVKEARPLDTLKAAWRLRITAERDRAIAGGADTPSGRVDTDEVSIRNILGAYQSAVAALMAGEPIALNWRMADNSLVALAASDVIAVGNAVMAHTQAAYARSWALKDALEAATTEAEVVALNVTTGWPS